MELSGNSNIEICSQRQALFLGERNARLAIAAAEAKDRGVLPLNLLRTYVSRQAARHHHEDNCPTCCQGGEAA